MIDLLIEKYFRIKHFSKYSELEFEAIVTRSNILGNVGRIFKYDTFDVVIETNEELQDLVYILENSFLKPKRSNVYIGNLKIFEININQQNTFIQNVIGNSFEYDTIVLTELVIDNKLPHYLENRLLTNLFSKEIKSVVHEQSLIALWDNRSKLSESTKTKIHECIDNNNIDSIVIGSLITGRRFENKSFFNDVGFTNKPTKLVLDDSFNDVKMMFNYDEIMTKYYSNITSLNNVDVSSVDMLNCICTTPPLSIAKNTTTTEQWFEFLTDDTMVLMLQYASLGNPFVDYTKLHADRFPISNVFIRHNYKYKYNYDLQKKIIINLDNYQDLMVIKHSDYLFKDNDDFSITNEVLREVLTVNDEEVVRVIIQDMMRNKTLIYHLEILIEFKHIVKNLINTMCIKTSEHYFQLVAINMLVDDFDVSGIAVDTCSMSLQDFDYNKLFKYFEMFDKELLVNYCSNNLTTCIFNEKFLKFYEEHFLSVNVLYDSHEWFDFTEVFLLVAFDDDCDFVDYEQSLKTKISTHVAKKIIHDGKNSLYHWFDEYIIDEPKIGLSIANSLPIDTLKIEFVDLLSQHVNVEII